MNSLESTISYPDVHVNATVLKNDKREKKEFIRTYFSKVFRRAGSGSVSIFVDLGLGGLATGASSTAALKKYHVGIEDFQFASLHHVA